MPVAASFPSSTGCISRTPIVPCSYARLLDLDSVHVSKTSLLLTALSPHLVPFQPFSSDPAPLFL